MPDIILATQESEIRRRIKVGSQPGKIVQGTQSQKNPSLKITGRVNPDVCPEFKPQYCKENEDNYTHLIRSF
jgi:hypothetical protein